MVAVSEAASADADRPETAAEVTVSVDATRLDRAVDAADLDTRAALVETATKEFIDDVLDEDGDLECPFEDCDRTFATRRQRRGHLGSSEHAVDVPDGEFWCGYCGYGPTSWRGVNGHHGSSDHDGDPIRLDEEPDLEDLAAPEDIPDHKNPDLLEQLYEEHGGTISEMCREHDFDVTPGRVRHYLIEFGIHDVTPNGPSEDGDGPVYRDPEWLRERYEEADGNISEMHRQLDEDIPYRTLLKNLKRLDIHDPTESPGRQQNEQAADGDADASEDDDSEAVDEAIDGAEEPAETDVVEPDENATEAVEGEQEDDAEDSFFGFAVEDPADVEEYADLETPEWSDEDSFYTALDMAATPEEFSNYLGGGDPETLRKLVEALGREDAFMGGRDD